MRSIKKSAVLLIAILMMVSALTSCNTTEASNTPQQVFQNYINGIIENDEDAINECYFMSSSAQEIREDDAKLLSAILSNSEFTVTSAEENAFAAKIKVMAKKPDYKSALEDMYLKNTDEVFFGEAEEDEDEEYYYELLTKCMGDDDIKVNKSRLTVSFMRVGDKWYLTGDNDEFFSYLFEDISKEKIQNTPEEAVEEFLEAFSDYDMKAVDACYYALEDSSSASEDPNEERLTEAIYSSLEYEITDCDVDGMVAEVTVEGEVKDYTSCINEVTGRLTKMIENGELNPRKYTEEEFTEFYMEQVLEYIESDDAITHSDEFSVYCILLDEKWYITGCNKDMVNFVLGDIL